MRGDIVPPPRQSQPLPSRGQSLPAPQPVSQPQQQPVQQVLPVPSQPRNEERLPQPAVSQVTELPRPMAEQPSTDANTPIKPSRLARVRSSMRRHKRMATLLLGTLVLIAIVVGLFGWYQMQLSAPQAGNTSKTRVIVPEGARASTISALLKQQGIIRSQQAFELYVRITGKASQLQSGAYRLGPGDDVASVVSHLTSGKSDTFSITFLPGATLAQHRAVLLKAGYAPQDVDAAFAAEYNEPQLFDGKPAGSDLEGFIYGETYEFSADATPKDIIQKSLDEYEMVIEKNNLKDAYAKRGFSVYQGITLASIIQREVATPSDAAQVAQVFEFRLQRNIALGSDVTYQYIADKTGQSRSVDLDSPYNTRRYQGLPPGPISSPGLDALKAVGSPASGDFMYFLSGDDDKTYFAHTNEEHEANIRQHCQQKCKIV